MDFAKKIDVFGEILSLAAAILLLIPALRVSYGLLNIRKIVSNIKQVTADNGLNDLAAKWAVVTEQLVLRWHKIDHRCLIGGLCVQLVASLVKIVRILCVTSNP